MTTRTKRALSTWKGNNIKVLGDSGEGADLRKAILRASDDGAKRKPAASDLTHAIHPYPAKLPPALVRTIIPKADEPILDPFCGSGTVVVEAARAGKETIGTDLNPIALLVSEAKSASLSTGQLKDLHNLGKQIAGAVLRQGKEAKKMPRDVLPPRGKGTISPFAPHIKRELYSLRDEIIKRTRRNPVFQVYLLSALSAIIVKVSRRRSETSTELVDQKFSRGFACQLFSTKVSDLRTGLSALRKCSPTSSLLFATADGRQLPLASGSIGTIITSPPYPGTYDYASQHDLRAEILGLDLKTLQAAELAPRRESSSSEFAQQWEKTLAEFLKEWARVLRPGGQAYLVLGDTAVDDFAILAAASIKRALPPELAFVASAGQRRKVWGKRERMAFAKLDKREWLIKLVKT